MIARNYVTVGAVQKLSLAVNFVKRLALLTTAICLTLCSLITGTIFVTQHQPQVELVPGLTTCDGMTCYQGIAPLKTSLEEALAILTNLPDTVTNHKVHSIDFMHGPVRAVLIQPDSGIQVQEIYLYLNVPALSIGDVISAWGEPCAIYTEQSGEFTRSLGVIAYPDKTIDVLGINGKINMFSPVGEIHLFPPLSAIIGITLDTSIGGQPSVLNPCSDLDKSVKHFSRWHGFGTYH